MAIEVSIVCDRCRIIIDAAPTATIARARIRDAGARSSDGKKCRVGIPGGFDLCWDCNPKSPDSGRETDQ